ncbi:N-formylglutamate amidohydrolase [Rhodococcus erythropolis]|uniref:N-formylglutamate amidohydrolase n=1 Tax=Rhodococcus erythropolis TaxID=1833 RepID=UPI00294A8BCE|nr:N-formylglutamate amidohydrolase [Rhodococcus erythropolis]MDV6274148.1 N-formylglutamate amidohydrolase [Rhodococcus erythropolis]
MTNEEPVLISAGTVVTPEDLTFSADRDSRSLDDAIAEADLLVSCPHSGSAIPAELSRFLAPEFTQRLQFDFTDMSTSPIVRRWAEIDWRIVYVENSRPRMIRDPNRAKPENPEASLREAFARVHKAGARNKADHTRVDAGWNSLAETFTETAEHGLGVLRKNSRRTHRNHGREELPTRPFVHDVVVPRHDEPHHWPRRRGQYRTAGSRSTPGRRRTLQSWRSRR